MTLLLTTLAFGSASCAYILHELRKAPRGIEIGGKFFICAEPDRAPEYGSAGDAALTSVHM
ncbi:MAG: hypothetical protein H0U43_07330 [Chthoniobacterales bacterium]|nr:hypothetical protein [Chthoniobacterales bacterium]